MSLDELALVVGSKMNASLKMATPTILASLKNNRSGAGILVGRTAKPDPKIEPTSEHNSNSAI